MLDLRSFRTVILLQNIFMAYNLYIADDLESKFWTFWVAWFALRPVNVKS